MIRPSQFRAVWINYLGKFLIDKDPGMIGNVPYLLVLRAIYTFIVFVRFVLPQSKRAGGLYQIAALIAAMSVVETTLFFLHRSQRGKQVSDRYRAAMAVSVVVDVALISWAYHLTATPTSDFFVFYFLPILTASEFLPLWWTAGAFVIVLAGLCTTIFTFRGVDTFDLAAMAAMRAGSVVLFAIVAIARTRLLRAKNSHLEERNRYIQTLLDFQEHASKYFAIANTNESLVDWMLRHLTVDLDFDFASVSAVDPHQRRISMIRTRNVPPGWMKRSTYPLDHKDILADIVRTGKAELLAGSDPRFDETTFQQYAHSKLVRIFAPLIHDQKAVGVLEVGCSIERRDYVNENFRYVEGLASHMGGPVCTIQMHDLMADAASRAIKAVHASSAAVCLFMDKTPTHQALLGRPSELSAIRASDPGNGEVGLRAMNDGKVQLIEKPEDLKLKHPDLYHAGIRAIAAFPLAFTERREGVLYLYFGERSKFREAELDLVRGITGAIQGAIWNRELLDEIAGSAKWGWMIASQQPVIQSLVADREIHLVLEDLAQNIQLTLGANSVVLYPYHLSNGEFSDPVHKGVSSSVAERLSADSIPRRLLRQDRTQFVVDISKAAWMGQRGFALREGLCSCAAVILRAQKTTEIVGVMFINYAEKQTFPDEICDAVASLASSAAIAIQAARLQRRVKPVLHDLRKEFVALREIDDLIARNLESPRTDEVLRMILTHAMASIGVEDAAVYLVRSDDLLEVRWQEGFRNSSLGAVRLGDGIIGRAATAGSLIENCAQPGGPRPSEIAVPLRAQDETLGVILLAHPAPGFFTEDHQAWLETLGMQGVIAIRSLESFEALQAPLRAITKVASRLQQTDGDLTMLLKIVLTGVTAKQGLGFTRAMIFRLEEDARVVQGLSAVGPMNGVGARADWAEADAIELLPRAEGQDVLDDLLDRAVQFERNLKAGGSRKPLDDRTGKCRIERGTASEALFAEVIESTSKVVSSESSVRRLAMDVGLEIGIGKDLAFVPLIEGKNRRIGFLIADRSYQRKVKPIQNVDLKNLEAFAELAVLALKTDSLRGTLSDEHRMEQWNQFMASTIHAVVGALSDTRSVVSDFNQSARQSPSLWVPEVEDFVDKLREHHARVLGVANSLRDYARPAVANFRRVCLNDVIRDTAANYPCVVPTLPPEPVLISGDPKRIQEALSNLITNSMEAAQESHRMEGLKIEVILWALDDDGQRLGAVMQVRDNAGGIKPEDRPHVLQPWYTTKGKGRGMGLPIVERIVKGHGGAILTDFDVPSGTSILVMLPVYSDFGGEPRAETSSG
jgi:signal transduction histidine kinase/putative methionine-R-sulfoxide reductase with GAF domain